MGPCAYPANPLTNKQPINAVFLYLDLDQQSPTVIVVLKPTVSYSRFTNSIHFIAVLCVEHAQSCFCCWDAVVIKYLLSEQNVVVAV